MVLPGSGRARDADRKSLFTPPRELTFAAVLLVAGAVPWFVVYLDNVIASSSTAGTADSSVGTYGALLLLNIGYIVRLGRRVTRTKVLIATVAFDLLLLLTLTGLRTFGFRWSGAGVVVRAMVGALALLLTAGCGNDTVVGQAIGKIPPTPSSASTAPASEVEPTTRAREPEPDTEDCFDGECELTLSEPVDLRVDPALGFRTLSVELSDSDTVLFQIRGDGTSGGGSISGGGRLRFNDLMIEVVAFADDGVTLELTRVD